MDDGKRGFNEFEDNVAPPIAENTSRKEGVGRDIPPSRTDASLTASNGSNGWRGSPTDEGLGLVGGEPTEYGNAERHLSTA